MFETNYSNNNAEYTILPPGKYECMIHKAFTNSKGRAIYFQVILIVRNDVTQQCQNRRIFHAIWQKKPENQTADDKKVDGFSYKQLMNLCESAGLPSGKKYADIDALGIDLIGKPVLVDIVNDEWNGKKQEKVKWTYVSKFPDCKHLMKEIKPAEESGGQLDVVVEDDDEDLPF